MNNTYIDEKIYCFWTDDNPITPNRMKGLDSMRENLGIPIAFLDKEGIEASILPEAPLHSGYKYLSAVHKSDYLRCYFMHHFGGGYADIKPYSKNNNWKQCFSLINRDITIDIIGIHEVENGTPFKEFNNPLDREKLLGNGFFIVRRMTNFTSLWYQRMLELMDEKLLALEKHPAPTSFGGPNYPLRWAEIQGEIFHRTIMDFYDENPRAFRNVLKSGWIRGCEYR